MKTVIVLLALCVSALPAGRCASDKEGSYTAAQQKEKGPEVGMTKDQVVAMYGKTDNLHVSSEGESWIYHLNMGEAFIPFNFGYRPEWF